MAFVVDASVTAAWLMPDEESPLAELVFERLVDETALVPAIWWFETRNLLIINERRNRIAVKMREELLSLLGELPADIDRAPDSVKIMAFARKHQLTVYDAAYIELAARKDIPLATLDRRLEAAARAEKIALLTT
jgi:predicted nucleic acid-binding protein